MSLSAARIVFTRSLGRLLVEADRLGLEVALDEAKRPEIAARWNASHCRVYSGGKRCELATNDPIHRETTPGGHVFRPIGLLLSTHRDGLAADLILYVAGKPSSERARFEPLGAYWKSLHPMLRWGGDFKGFADLGHFSHEWQGRK